MKSNWIACIALSIAAAWGLISCSSKTQSGTSYSLESEPSAVLQHWVSDIELIPVPQGHPISFVTKIAYRNGAYYILTGNGLFLFSPEKGTFREISAYGNSNAEWLRLNTFYFSEKDQDLCLIDSFKSNILHYSLQGTYQYTEHLNGLSSFEVTDAAQVGNDLILSCGLFRDQSCIYLKAPGKDFSAAIKLKELAFKSQHAIQGIGKHTLSDYNANLRCVVPFDNHIYEIKDDLLTVTDTIPTPSPVPSAKFLAESSDFSLLEMGVRCLNGKISPCFSGIYETSKWILLPFFDAQFTLLDKDTKKAYFADTTCMNEALGFPLSNIQGSNGDTLLCYWNALDFSSRFDALKQPTPLREKIQARLAELKLNPDDDFIIAVHLSK